MKNGLEQDFMPYGKQDITAEDIEAVTEALKCELITQGMSVPAFENALTTYTGANWCVAVNSATSALHIACLALGLSNGDLLWTTPISFVASANCGAYCGADVDFVDIDLDTGLMSVRALERKLAESDAAGRLPKIVVVVHLAGSSCEMQAIASLSKKYDFRVIEDASHAIGGRYRDSIVGSCVYSDVCIFSFHPVKIVTTGEGGCALTNDRETARVMQELRSHGITKNEKRFIGECKGPWSYEQQHLGFNYRMTDIQAALGISQLKRLDQYVSERNKIFLYYKSKIAEGGARMLSVPAGVYSAHHLAIVRLATGDASTHKQAFIGMRNAGIGVQLHYTPIHLQPYYLNRGFTAGLFPNAELYGSSCFSLPIYPGLKDRDLARVVDSLKSSLQ